MKSKEFRFIPWLAWIVIIYSSIVLIVFGLAGCSDAKKLQRIQRRNPYLFAHIKDTIHYHDTLRLSIRAAKLDSSFVRPGLDMTGVYYFENAEIKGKIQINKDSVHVNFERKEFDTLVPINIEIPVHRYAPVTPYRKPRDGLRRLERLAFYTIGVLGFVWLVYLLRREKNNGAKGT